MQPNNNITTPSRSAVHAIVKKEDGDDDGDDTFISRPQLPKPLVVMRDLATLIGGRTAASIVAES